MVNAEKNLTPYGTLLKNQVPALMVRYYAIKTRIINLLNKLSIITKPEEEHLNPNKLYVLRYFGMGIWIGKRYDTNILYAI